MKTINHAEQLRMWANNIQAVLDDIKEWQECSIVAVTLQEFASDFLKLEADINSARAVIENVRNSFISSSTKVHMSVYDEARQWLVEHPKDTRETGLPPVSNAQWNDHINNQMAALIRKVKCLEYHQGGYGSEEYKATCYCGHTVKTTSKIDIVNAINAHLKECPKST